MWPLGLLFLLQSILEPYMQDIITGCVFVVDHEELLLSDYCTKAQKAHSRFEIQHPRFEIRDSRFEIRDSISKLTNENKVN